MLQARWIGWGLWEGSQVPSIDYCIVDADAPSYVQDNLSWEARAKRAVSAKKSKYGSSAGELQANFTLLCFPQRESFIVNMQLTRSGWPAALPESVKSCSPSPWHGCASIRTQFSLFRSVDLCLRGTRQRICGLGLHDEAAIGAG